jgi:non-specific serine/threonine protein kinase
MQREQQVVLALVRELLELVRSSSASYARVQEAAPDRPVRPSSEAPGARRPAGSILRREGEYWAVIHGGRVSRYRHTSGIDYLARLLARPGHAFHVIELHDSFVACGDAGPVIDSKAKDQYRRRLGELDDAVERAKRLGDAERVGELQSEIESLASQLNAALGLGGRPRRASAVVERLRVNATRAIRSAIERIRESDAQLGRHLAKSIRTGAHCSYQPDSDAPCSWDVG